MRIIHLALPAALALLAGCTPVDVGFGDSVRVDMAAQTLNPEPPPPAEGAPIEGANGEKGERAVTRYETGNVTELQIYSSTSRRGGGGGGGGNGGGGGGSGPD